MDQSLKFMPLMEPMEPIELAEHCDEITVFDKISPQNHDQEQLPIDLGFSRWTSTDKRVFDQWATAREADEDKDEKTSEFHVVKRPNPRVHQYGPCEANCTRPKVNRHPSHFFRSTSLKGESRTTQREYGSHFIQLRTTPKKLIWLVILASVTVPVVSAANVSHYFDATVLASGMLANIPSICVGTNLIPPTHGSFRLAVLWTTTYGLVCEVVLVMLLMTKLRRELRGRFLKLVFVTSVIAVLVAKNLLRNGAWSVINRIPLCVTLCAIISCIVLERTTLVPVIDGTARGEGRNMAIV